MPTPRKEQDVRELAELLSKSSSVVLTDYRGLKMKDFNDLRSRLRPENVQFHVVKNTLLRLAAKDTPLESLVQNLEGPTAAAFSLDDAVAGPRLIGQFIKDSKSPMTVKSGVVEGGVYEGPQIEAIGKLPPKEQLIAQVVGGLQAPIAGLAGTLQQLLGSVVWTLQGIADQKSGA